MSERKVLNKYFPPDFDPAIIPRRKVSKNKQIKVRLITPFSMRCEACGEYIYKGKKFNAKKELTNEEYLGIQIFRFYIRCSKCSSEITFKTDPRNNDYKAEHGAQRKSEVWNTSKEDESNSQKDEEEEAVNPMEALENRTRESKREIDISNALDEIRAVNARNELMDSGNILQEIIKSSEEMLLEKRKKEDEEDSLIAREVFSNVYKKKMEDEHSEIASAGISAFGNPSELHRQTDKSSARKRKQDSVAKLFGISLKKNKDS